MIFVLDALWAPKRKPATCKADDAFWFSHFLVPSQQKNHRKSIYCHGKYFSKEKFCAPPWLSAKCYCRNKMGKAEKAAPSCPLRVANHSTEFGSSCPRVKMCFFMKAQLVLHFNIQILMFRYLNIYHSSYFHGGLCKVSSPLQIKWKYVQFKPFFPKTLLKII